MKIAGSTLRKFWVLEINLELWALARQSLREYFCILVRHCLVRNFTHRLFSVHTKLPQSWFLSSSFSHMSNKWLYNNTAVSLKVVPQNCKSVRDNAIGIMGSKSLALTFSWLRFMVIQQQGTRKKEYTCLCCFLPPRWNTFKQLQSSNCKTTINHNNFRHCRVSFSPIVRQPSGKSCMP